MRWRVAGVAWVVVMLAGCGTSRPVLGDAALVAVAVVQHAVHMPLARAA